MQARSSAAGQAIGKQFKITTSGMFSMCLVAAIVVGRTQDAARAASSPVQKTGVTQSPELLWRVREGLNALYADNDG
jgi:hypothetical protein